MVRKLGAAVATATLFLGLGTGPASADPVGEPGTPSCHGERVSHGSSDHGLTPKERAGFLETSVKEYHERVRLSCSADPPQ